MRHAPGSITGRCPVNMAKIDTKGVHRCASATAGPPSDGILCLFCGHLGIVIPIIYIDIISQRPPVVKQDCNSSYIYIFQKSAVKGRLFALKSPFVKNHDTSFRNVIFRHHKVCKPHLHHPLVALTQITLYFVCSSPFTSLFGTISSLGKSHLPHLCIYLHFTDTQLSI